MPDFEVNNPADPIAGEASPSVAEQERELRMAENAFGRNSIEAAAVLVKLGGVQRSAGRLTEAHRSFVRALEITEDLLGPDHAKLACIYYCLAELELARGRFLTGEPYARRSLEICERTPAGFAVRVKVLAALLAGQGRSAESEALLRSAATMPGSAAGGAIEADHGAGQDET